jgi:hypothetical protein
MYYLINTTKIVSLAGGILIFAKSGKISALHASCILQLRQRYGEIWRDGFWQAETIERCAIPVIFWWHGAGPAGN